MDQNVYDKWDLFLKPVVCFKPLTDSFFWTLLPSGALRELSENFYRRGCPRKLEMSYIMYYISWLRVYEDSFFGRSPRRAPGGKGGFRGSPPSVKRTSVIVTTVEIFQAFHDWEARAPSTYLFCGPGRKTWGQRTRWLESKITRPST